MSQAQLTPSIARSAHAHIYHTIWCLLVVEIIPKFASSGNLYIWPCAFSIAYWSVTETFAKRVLKAFDRRRQV